MTDQTCRCGRPTRDEAYFCDDCAKALSVALGEIPWVAEQLDLTITRQTRMGSGNGGRRATETPVPFHPTASEAMTNLRAVLVSWVKFCDEEGVRNQSPHRGLPDDDLTSISRWLLWRVDGLSLHDIGPDAVDEITSAVAHGHRLIDRPADRQYLGHCRACDEGRLYGTRGSMWARCEVCADTTNADELKTSLLRDLDDRLCTASEIARLSTYLGLKADRETVRKRINKWVSRGRITAEASFSDEPTFRFGDIYERLTAEEYGVSA